MSESRGGIDRNGGRVGDGRQRVAVSDVEVCMRPNATPELLFGCGGQDALGMGSVAFPHTNTHPCRMARKG